MQLAIIIKKNWLTSNIQNNQYFLQCMVIGEFLFIDDSKYLRDIKDNNLKPVISQLRGN